MAASNRNHAYPEGNTDEYHLKKMNEILSGCRVPRSSNENPGQLFDWLFIGSYADAENYGKLKALGITHVINCAAFRQCPLNPYPREAGIVGYLQFNADDSEYYNMLQHFPKARAFIDNARAVNGRVLVHCAAGINRCGAICTAYVMMNKRWDLLSTVAFIKSKRRLLLCNRNFRRQLVLMARQHNLLKKTDVMETNDALHLLHA